MITAYFDESGSHADSDVLTVATVASTEQGWEAFHKEWEKVLNQYGVERFHATDYRNCRQQFKEWTKNGDKHQQFLLELLPILRRHAVFGFGCSMKLVNWNERMADLFPEPQKERRQPLLFLMRGCFDALQLNSFIPQNEEIACIYDHKQKIVGSSQDAFDNWQQEFSQEDRFVSFTVQKRKKGIYGLEAADLLAYAGRNQHQQLSGYVKQTGRPTPDLYKSLAADLQFHFWAITQDGLRSYRQAEFPEMMARHTQP